MVPLVTGRRLSGLALMAAMLAPQLAAAQPAPEPSPRLWITAGGGTTTVLADCRNCEGETPYRHGGSVLANGGVRINPQMDAGAELFWVPGTSRVTGDRNRATMLLGVAQFRPWRGHGFFLKGGMGMGFVRNWVYDADSETAPPYTAKGLAVTYGAGWALWRERRVGLQLSGTQHVLTIGDIETSGFVAENVVANVWTLGAAVVIR